MYQDFEPFIDTHTMKVHCYKHEQTYLNNLNYLNERVRYIDNFKNIADFTNASLIYDKIV